MTVGKWLMGVGICMALATGQALAAEPSEAQVRELMQVMGMPQTLEAMSKQVATMMNQQMPCIPASYWQDYIDKNGQEQLTKAMVPAYQHHFSADDVQALIKFYKTPLGQKLVAQIPAVMAETSQIGQQWGQQRIDDMFASLKKDGKLDAQGRCPGTAGSTSPAPAGSAGGAGQP